MILSLICWQYDAMRYADLAVLQESRGTNREPRIASNESNRIELDRQFDESNQIESVNQKKHLWLEAPKTKPKPKRKPYCDITCMWGCVYDMTIGWHYDIHSFPTNFMTSGGILEMWLLMGKCLQAWILPGIHCTTLRNQTIYKRNSEFLILPCARNLESKWLLNGWVTIFSMESVVTAIT